MMVTMILARECFIYKGFWGIPVHILLYLTMDFRRCIM